MLIIIILCLKLCRWCHLEYKNDIFMLLQYEHVADFSLQAMNMVEEQRSFQPTVNLLRYFNEVIECFKNYLHILLSIFCLWILGII